MYVFYYHMKMYVYISEELSLYWLVTCHHFIGCEEKHDDIKFEMFKYFSRKWNYIWCFPTRFHLFVIELIPIGYDNFVLEFHHNIIWNYKLGIFRCHRFFLSFFYANQNSWIQWVLSYMSHMNTLLFRKRKKIQNLKKRHWSFILSTWIWRIL